MKNREKLHGTRLNISEIICGCAAMLKRMRKLIFASLIVFAMLALVACGNDKDTQEPQELTQSNNHTIATAGEQPSVQPHEWTIEELGTTIIEASTFWDDWWSFRRAFAWDDHIYDSFWYYWVEQPEHPRSRGFSILLPSSGFESLNDIGIHLLQFYTQSWVDRELFGESRFHVEIDGIYYNIFGSPWAFEEYDGVLYVATARYGSIRPDWTTANHNIIQHDGNSMIAVETIVTAYDHHGSGDEMPTATFHFTFIDGKIESGLGVWTWPDPSLDSFGRIIEQEGRFWDDWRNFSFPFNQVDWDVLIQHNGHDYLRLLPSSGFENIEHIRTRLSWNYTESWVDQLLANETPPFLEYNGELYINMERPRIANPVWDTATHVLIEQDGQHAIVETTVGLMYMGEVSLEASFRFTFVEWRIDSSEGLPCFSELAFWD